ncbi:MAG: TraR/DksA family transcriptional regulator [Thermoanaerobaculia bacterium]
MAKPTPPGKAARKKASSGDALRERLEEQRQEILSLYEHDLRVGQQASDEGSEDIVDRANNSYNREFMFALSDTERKILLEMDEALERLDDETYGTCLNCDERIPKLRLQAVPWARYCIDCQERVEQGLVLDT